MRRAVATQTALVALVAVKRIGNLLLRHRLVRVVYLYLLIINLLLSRVRVEHIHPALWPLTFSPPTAT